MRLHARPRAPFSPQQPLCKLRGTRPLSLGPEDERFAEHLFPAPERAPNIAVRTPHRLRRMTNRAEFQNRGEQIEQRVAERGTALLTGLEGITQVQAEGRLGFR